MGTMIMPSIQWKFQDMTAKSDNQLNSLHLPNNLRRPSPRPCAAPPGHDPEDPRAQRVGLVKHLRRGPLPLVQHIVRLLRLALLRGTTVLLVRVLDQLHNRVAVVAVLGRRGVPEPLLLVDDIVVGVEAASRAGLLARRLSGSVREGRRLLVDDAARPPRLPGGVGLAVVAL